jgi:hypothetical protein
MVLNLGCIVEGHGDVEAVPELLRRIWRELDPGFYLKVQRPWRMGRYKLVKVGELETAIERMVRQLPRPRAILILIDAETDCPGKLGPELLARAKAARPDIRTGLVLAKREFEAWFLAAIESLRGQCGIADDAEEVSDPEAVSDAKGFIRHNMERGRGYSETLDQPALTASFNMHTARQRSDSFDKCWREVARLFAEASREAEQKAPESG